MQDCSTESYLSSILDQVIILDTETCETFLTAVINLKKSKKSPNLSSDNMQNVLFWQMINDNIWVVKQKQWPLVYLFSVNLPSSSVRNMKAGKTNAFCLRGGQIFNYQVLKVSLLKTEVIVEKWDNKPWYKADGIPNLLRLQ